MYPKKNSTPQWWTIWIRHKCFNLNELKRKRIYIYENPITLFFLTLTAYVSLSLDGMHVINTKGEMKNINKVTWDGTMFQKREMCCVYKQGYMGLIIISLLWVWTVFVDHETVFMKIDQHNFCLWCVMPLEIIWLCYQIYWVEPPKWAPMSHVPATPNWSFASRRSSLLSFIGSR